MSLSKKIVRASSPQLIQFFEPDYELRSELSVLDADKKIIYTGKQRPQIKKYLMERTKDFIVWVPSGSCDIDFTNGHDLCDYVAELRGKPVTKKMNEYIDLVCEGNKTAVSDDLEPIAKRYLYSGRWNCGNDSKEGSIYSLFSNSYKHDEDVVSVYFKLREDYPYPIIRSSFITFLRKCYTLEGLENNSYNYRKLCEDANKRWGKDTIRDYLREFTKEPTEINFIRLIRIGYKE